MSQTRQISNDAGLTILEVLIVLSIVASIVGLGVAGLRRVAPSPPEARDVRSFLSQVRNDALVSGQTFTLLLSPTGIAAARRSLEFSTPMPLQFRSRRPLTEPIQLMVTPDGLIAGPQLFLADKTGLRPLFIWDALSGADE